MPETIEERLSMMIIAGLVVAVWFLRDEIRVARRTIRCSTS
jgi:hypothetical protein